MRNSRSVFLAWLLLVSGLVSACRQVEQVPTYRVELQPFSQKVTAEGVLAAEQVTTVNVPAEVERSVRLAWIAEDGAVVEADQLVARFDAGEMQRQLAEGESELETSDHKSTKARVDSGVKVAAADTAYEIAGLDLELAQQFQMDDREVYSKQEILEDVIDEELAIERQEHATAKRQMQRQLGQSELDLLAIDRRQARHKIDLAERGLESLEVRAPHAGILTLKRNWRGDPPQVGSELWKGQPLAEIPDLDSMKAEVFVLEADAGGLEVGKTATVVIEAHPDHSFEAEIERVDSVAQPRHRGSPVQYFGVQLKLSETDPAIMKPGQRVRARINLTDLDEALVLPRQAVFLEDGKSWAWVRQGAGFEKRQVEIAASSMGLLALESGLESGDEVALRAPSDTSTTTEAAANSTVLEVGVGSGG